MPSTPTALAINTMAVFVYRTDHVTEPAAERQPMRFTEVYLAQVVVADFRRNPRGELGTRTATLDRAGIQKLRANWIYREITAKALSLPL